MIETLIFAGIAAFCILAVPATLAAGALFSDINELERDE